MINMILTGRTHDQPRLNDASNPLAFYAENDIFAGLTMSRSLRDLFQTSDIVKDESYHPSTFFFQLSLKKST